MILRLSSSARISQGVEVEVVQYKMKPEISASCFFFFFFNDSSAAKPYTSFKESTCNGDIIMAGS